MGSFIGQPLHRSALLHNRQGSQKPFFWRHSSSSLLVRGHFASTSQPLGIRYGVRGWTTRRHHNSKTHVDPAWWFKERETPPRFRGTRTSPWTGRRLLGARSGSGATAGALTETQEHIIHLWYVSVRRAGRGLLCRGNGKEDGSKHCLRIGPVFRGRATYPVVTYIISAYEMVANHRVVSAFRRVSCLHGGEVPVSKHSTQAASLSVQIILVTEIEFNSPSSYYLGKWVMQVADGEYSVLPRKVPFPASEITGAVLSGMCIWMSLRSYVPRRCTQIVKLGNH